VQSQHSEPSGLKNDRVVNPARRSSYRSGEGFRAVIRLIVGVAIGFSAAVTWQSYENEGRKLARTWAPSLAWLLPESTLGSPPDDQVSAQDAALPQSAPVTQKPARTATAPTQLLEPITRDLAAIRSSLELVAAKQEQVGQSHMAQSVVSTEPVQQLEPIARDLAAVRSSLELVAAKQEQMAQSHMAQSVVSTEPSQLLEPITRDLAAVRNSLEEVAARQEQMVQSIATLHAVVEQYIKQKLPSPPPSQAVPLPAPKPPRAAR
jgi:hypothetical protein